MTFNNQKQKGFFYNPRSLSRPHLSGGVSKRPGKNAKHFLIIPFYELPPTPIRLLEKKYLCHETLS